MDKLLWQTKEIRYTVKIPYGTNSITVTIKFLDGKFKEVIIYPPEGVDDLVFPNINWWMIFVDSINDVDQFINSEISDN